MNFQSAPRKPVVLTNLSSSSSEDISGALTSIFERFGYGRPEMFVGRSEDMGSMMDGMREAGGDLLVSYGGDGTAAAVASIAREQDVPFIALPGGTMNMLMGGLYGSDDWQECLMRGLAVAQPRPMTAGVVTDADGRDHPFLVGCMMGKPTRMSEAREELRDGRVMEAAKGAVDALKRTSDSAPLYFALNDGDYDGRPLELINVTCPFMDGESLDPDAFDLTLFDTVTGGATLSLGLSAMLGNLRQSQEVETVQTDRFRMRADRPMEALLDGEPHTFDGEVTIRLDKACGQVMAPWPAMSFPSAKAMPGRPA
ncbi:diacylglycerol kinase family protein [uncultured Algimonas sp.]|uniref:diacylglycerol/lipid kinase family protein n=1 Tax=uncultured Algimonas sp. TaxID=1547920 RepID=UPI002616B1CF|nr:diacylglycerol kinase family protein [uncultured Algimonas sp.]